MGPSSLPPYHGRQLVVTAKLPSESAAELSFQSAPAAPSPIGAMLRQLAPRYRERQILQYVCKGLSNKDIAKQVGLRVGTVKAYMHRVFKKMRVRDRLEAIQAWKKLHG